MSQAIDRKAIRAPAGMHVLIVGMGWWGRGATAADALKQAPTWRSGQCLVWHVPPEAYVDQHGALRYHGDGPEPDLVAKAHVTKGRTGLTRLTAP